MYRRTISQVCFSRKWLSRFSFFYFNPYDNYRVVASEAKIAKALPIVLVQKFNKRNLEKSTILNELNAILSCDDKISAEIYYNFVSDMEQLSLAKKNIELFTDNGVSLEFIRNNSVVLSLPNG